MWNGRKLCGEFSWPRHHVISLSLGCTHGECCPKDTIRSVLFRNCWPMYDNNGHHKFLQSFDVRVFDHGPFTKVQGSEPPCFAKPPLDRPFWKCQAKGSTRTFVDIGPLLHEAVMWFPIY